MKFRCRKRRYRDRVEALAALAQANLRSKRNSSQAQKREELRAYECDRCRGWHLTSQERET